MKSFGGRERVGKRKEQEPEDCQKPYQVARMSKHKATHSKRMKWILGDIKLNWEGKELLYSEQKQNKKNTTHFFLPEKQIQSKVFSIPLGPLPW